MIWFEYENDNFDPKEHAQSHDIQWILACWDSARGKNITPQLNQFNLNTLHHYRDYLFLLSPVQDDFQYLHYGHAIVKETGLDMAGQNVSDFPYQHDHRFLMACRNVTEKMHPLYMHHSIQNGVYSDTWEQLILPVFNKKEELFLIVFNHFVRSEHEFLKIVFNTSLNGIIAASAIYEGEYIVDFKIEFINDYAARILSLSEQDAINMQFSQIWPQFSTMDDWRHYKAVIETGSNTQFESSFGFGGHTSVYRIRAAKLGDGIVITFANIGDFVAKHDELIRQRTDLIFAAENLELQASELAELAETLDAARTELKAEMQRREELENELRLLAEVDSLSSLANRRHFLKQSEDILQDSVENNNVALIAFDIDRFKSINDTLGHAAGDVVITKVGEVTQFIVNEQIGLSGRIGGEEFAILMPKANIEEAAVIAEALRNKIEELDIINTGQKIIITASFGVVERMNNEPFSAMLARADNALYRAKDAGRNCIVVARFERAQLVKNDF